MKKYEILDKIAKINELIADNEIDILMFMRMGDKKTIDEIKNHNRILEREKQRLQESANKYEETLKTTNQLVRNPNNISLSGFPNNSKD